MNLYRGEHFRIPLSVKIFLYLDGADDGGAGGGGGFVAPAGGVFP